MTVFCPYSLDKLDTADINEIAENHHSTFARRKGKCERIENSERKSTAEFRNAKKELNEGEETDTLNFSLYLQRLAESLFQTYRLGNIDVSLEMDLEENVFFNMDTAVPLGIVVNELVSNSPKHAFRGREKGTIQIKLLKDWKISLTKIRTNLLQEAENIL